ncbi:polysaccharide deacetylase family protein [Desulfitobacterium sp.]|uniref:polysaccharide deacetylase family protein n=1 Tax=Desulfitobacterium sp. TaxID=49981 RepID=UPI002B21E6FB|nr:polysaccharide deacetylase family protein [Desulfitobacterium sp.]MEA4901630.1 polysaccharide deacetylase family protein [Desulfitobacterium sp.]
MGFKRNLILAGISLFILTIILFNFKWPLNFTFGDHHSEVKSAEQVAPTSDPSNSTPTPALTPDNQDKPKLSEFPKEGIPVLMYHSISTIPGNTLGVPVKQFTEEMEWLHRQNYHSLSLEEFYQALANGTPVPEKPILLTFDDGYSDNYNDAWPILRQYGFRATFFITTNSVGPGMMNWDQLNDLARQGNSIGSHTVNHLDLATLSDKQQKSELTNSKQELEKNLGISEIALCFPSGRYNKTTLDLMPELGYKLGFTTQPGKVHLGDDLLTLKRVRISGGMSLASFRELFP